MRKRNWLFILPLLLLIVYLLGPKPSTPVYSSDMPAVPSGANDLVSYVAGEEAAHKLKKDNEARIVWFNDSLKNITPCSIVYLHGFSASQEEGDPVHEKIAKEYGCNLYLSRLAEHGIDTTEVMANLTADKYWESAKRALAIGRKLGQKVILMGTSTGGTLALKLAAAYPDVYALVLMSPNIEIDDPNAWLLNNPWGLQIARMVKSGKYIESTSDTRPEYKQYWTPKYRIEAAVALEELLESSMTPATFHRIDQPTLVLYYYKDEVHRDSTVRVSAIKKMYEELGTPAGKKRAVSVPNAGNHVIASWIKSKDVATVEAETAKFFTEVLGLPKH
ncbi:MAG: alpha/beta hydrolase [Pseudobacter sp.]|uniref:alpha/beta hydrolase n=1 Tax=Pseudobacter sp. TaxID=2045420 RepID=UPI003F81404B